MLNRNEFIKDSARANTLLKAVKAVNIKAINKGNFPYIFIWILYYAWVVAFTTWWTASPVVDMVFSSGLRSVIHSINLISSAFFVFIIKKEWFVKSSRVGAIIITAGMSLYLLVGVSQFRLISVLVIGITLGIVNISILIPYVFVLNNTEKFYSVVISNAIINITMMILEGTSGSVSGGRKQLITLILLVIPLSATIFFRQSSIASGERDMGLPVIKPRIYITLAYSCAVAILCKGAGKGVLDIITDTTGSHIQTWYYIGGILGCLIYIAVYAASRYSFTWISNITFCSITMGLMFSVYSSEIPVMGILFAILLGIGNTVGMISMYYILGVVGKKYNSLRYVRLSILLIGICGGVSGIVVGNLISRVSTVKASIMSSLLAAVFMIIFLILSPFITNARYYNDWASDTCRSEISRPAANPFVRFGLSKRETDICKLLLEGYTMRQIAAILSISYSTVNTYCTSLYRKLNINSRPELMLMFKNYLTGNDMDKNT
jgi:DNA-binding CsgD family transcriptional regulator